MTKGFYNLTSGILSQTRRLNVVGNNMTNLSTPGYKAEFYTDTTFDNVLMSRINGHERTPIGEESYILAPDREYTDYHQGGLEETGLNLDFAIVGEGYFAVQTNAGIRYTRDGSFSVDAEGYLTLPVQGRVLGTDGNPIHINTDHINADGYGRIYTADGDFAGQIGVFAFGNEAQLEKGRDGLFVANGQAPQAVQSEVLWKYIEGSNVNMVTEMGRMLTTQRALQSAAQILKLYDGILTKTTSEVGKI